MKHRILATGISLVLFCTACVGCGRKYIEIEELPVLNYTAPQEGEEIVCIHVKDYGNIKIKLFSDLLPKACENFTTLAKQGYYDELIFHRVIENFMIQGGDPNGDTTGGESCWGGYFNGGVSEQLIHVPGAVAYANSGDISTDGSQFYIVTGMPVTDAMLDDWTGNNALYFTKEAKKLYTQYGGTPWLDGNYTIFGQVIDGLDIVYEISKLETNASDKPKKAVYMESVSVEYYDGSQIRWYPAEYGLESGVQ
ncbi:MAG: peptidylprolyl isomerase [Oscillospiraceae bacterium]|nr:peptidylprolyl isomerase [Oscillospiraceae bacterium]